MNETLQSIKKKIVNKKELDLSGYIFISSSINQKYLALSYIKNWQSYNSLKEIVYLKLLTKGLYDVNKIYIVESASSEFKDYEKVIFIPEITEEDFEIYLKLKLPSIDNERSKRLIELCHHNMFTLNKEVDKLLIDENITENISLLTKEGNYNRLISPSTNDLIIGLLTCDKKVYEKELNKNFNYFTIESLQKLYNELLENLLITDLIYQQDKITKDFLLKHNIEKEVYLFIKTNVIGVLSNISVKKKIEFLNNIKSKPLDLSKIKYNLILLFIIK